MSTKAMEKVLAEIATPAPVVTLVKPGPGLQAFGSERWDRGERIILVNGERWGRTRVSSHGVYGMKHRFEQEGGDILADKPGKEWSEYMVWSTSPKKSRRSGEEHQPTEWLVREMAQSLVAQGKLRDPKVVREEQRKANDRWKAKRALDEEREAQEFRTRAMAAIPASVTTLLHDHLASQAAIKLGNEMTDAIVGAMRWAQTR